MVRSLFIKEDVLNLNAVSEICVPQVWPNLWPIWQVLGPWASLYGANGQMTMTVHSNESKQIHRTLNGKKICQAVTEIWVPQVWQPPARPPEPWRQYPFSPKGWGVKTSPSHTVWLTVVMVAKTMPLHLIALILHFLKIYHSNENFAA